MKVFLLRLFLLLIIVICLQCVHTTTGGGGSEVEVIGYVYLCDKEPAPATQIKLIPSDYDPSVMGDIPDSLIDTSDNKGRYSFKNIFPGIYNIYGVQLNQHTKMLITKVEVVKDTITIVPDGVLKETGRIRILLPGGMKQNGYVIVPGTEISAFIPSGSKEVILDSIPATT
ncbi:MAG: hypothetical protein N2053_10255, partial [Chitinispirillaceae bacterium]|nr:hypothetical protein [Chitinispirillaceae bacterium]